MQPAKVNYKIYQGSTFQEIFRWESDAKIYVPIQNIAKSAPCVITTQTPHDLPVGWRFRVVGASGMKEINSVADTYYINTAALSANQIQINSVNSLAYTQYTNGGVVEYNQPINLADYSARMQIRETVDSSIILYEATTATGHITIDNTNKYIKLVIPANITQNFTFSAAVYSMELYTTTEVIPFINGNLTLVQEVTR